MSYFKASILFIALVTVLFGCSTDDHAANKDSLKIYTTIYPIEYAVQQISGETIDTISIYPPGVDAHTYEPTTKDMTDIAKGDAFIYLGAGMEAFAESAADALQNQDVALIELGKHEELFHVEQQAHEEDEHGHDGHDHGDHDPHIWIDPLRMLAMSEIIKEELINLHPESEAEYQKNFETLKEKLLTLDKEFTETLQEKNNKNILVTHSAYGYWERYGIEQKAIKGLSTTNEPSQKELTEIIDQAIESNLNYIIFEQNTSDRLSEVIQEEIGAESVMIHNLAVLTDEDIANEEDYLSLMKKNLETLDKITK